MTKLGSSQPSSGSRRGAGSKLCITAMGSSLQQWWPMPAPHPACRNSCRLDTPWSGGPDVDRRLDRAGSAHAGGGPERVSTDGREHRDQRALECRSSFGHRRVRPLSRSPTGIDVFAPWPSSAGRYGIVQKMTDDELVVAQNRNLDRKDLSPSALFARRLEDMGF